MQWYTQHSMIAQTCMHIFANHLLFFLTLSCKRNTKTSNSFMNVRTTWFLAHSPTCHQESFFIREMMITSSRFFTISSSSFSSKMSRTSHLGYTMSWWTTIAKSALISSPSNDSQYCFCAPWCCKTQVDVFRKLSTASEISLYAAFYMNCFRLLNS